MNKLPDIISYPSLIEAIVGQFAFMKTMSSPVDWKYKAVQEIDLNDVYKKAHTYFDKYLSLDFIICQDELNQPFQLYIYHFLLEWKEIVDVTAIQQNVHNLLNHSNRI